jgi:hypothetical protein
MSAPARTIPGWSTEGDSARPRHRQRMIGWGLGTPSMAPGRSDSGHAVPIQMGEKPRTGFHLARMHRRGIAGFSSRTQRASVPRTCAEFPTAARFPLTFPLRSCRACGRNSWRKKERCSWRSLSRRCLAVGHRCPAEGSRRPHCAAFSRWSRRPGRRRLSFHRTRKSSHRATEPPSHRAIEHRASIIEPSSHESPFRDHDPIGHVRFQVPVSACWDDGFSRCDCGVQYGTVHVLTGLDVKYCTEVHTVLTVRCRLSEQDP